MEKVVALSRVFVLGMCFPLFGSLSVKLMPRLKNDQGKFSSLISVFMFTSEPVRCLCSPDRPVLFLCSPNCPVLCL